MKKKSKLIEFSIILILTIIVYLAAGHLDILENIVEFAHNHEEWELDELIVVGLFWFFIATFLLIKKIKLNKKINLELQNTNSDLQNSNSNLKEAIEQINQLKGIVPICANCKDIRDDAGYWHQLEAFVEKHSSAQFSHGICPDCSKKLYPEIDLKKADAEQQ